jgi:nickel/cobalt exporter
MTLLRPAIIDLAAVTGALVLVLAAPTPTQAHWADLAVAEIIVGDADARITLTFPTGLAGQADDNRDGQLSPDEVRSHRAELEATLGGRILLTDGAEAGTLTVESTATLPSNLNSAPGTHSTLLLIYRWPRSVQRLEISYGLFLPGVFTASCLATILQGGRVRTVVFTPASREFSFATGSPWSRTWRFLSDRLMLLVSLLTLAGGIIYLAAASRRAKLGRLSASFARHDGSWLG